MQRKVASYGVVSSVLVGREEETTDSPWFRERSRHTRPARRYIFTTSWLSAKRTMRIFGVASSARVFERGWPSSLCVLVCHRGYLRSVEPRFDLLRRNKLLFWKTFADQAVIAIENVRLFQELQFRNRDLTEALDQQTATSEVLKVISRSAFDLQPVLDTLVESAARLCSAERGYIMRLSEDGQYHLAVSYPAVGELEEFVRQHPLAPDRGSITGRVALERRTVQIEDVLADPNYRLQEQQRIEGYRSLLGVPLLRDGIVIGVFVLWRNRVDRFTDKQIDLVTTFADQAVIAIENVRLFQELQQRNRDLTEALEQQTATSKILEVIASSPTDLQPVMDAIAESAARLCDGASAFIQRVDGNVMRASGGIPLSGSSRRGGNSYRSDEDLWPRYHR